MKKTLLIIGLALANVTAINVKAQNAAPAPAVAPAPNLRVGDTLMVPIDGVNVLVKVQKVGNDIVLKNLSALADATPAVVAVPAAAPVAYQAAPQPVVAPAPQPAVQYVPVQAAPQTTAAVAAPASAPAKSGPSVAGVFGGLVKNSASSAIENGTEAAIEGRVGADGKKIGFGKGALAGAAGGATKTVVSDGLGALAPGLFDKGNIFTGKK